MKNNQLNIIFEDQDLLVFNKPPGLVVNSATSVKEESIQDLMEKYLNHKDKNAPNWQELVPDDFNDEYGSPQEIFNQRHGMVHRLDKNTSGCLVWAKNPSVLVNLLSQFRNREVEKQYVCLVHGNLRVKKGEISVPIARAKKDSRKFAPTPDGRPAQTFYQVVREFKHFNLEALVKNLSPENQKQIKRSLNFYQAGFSLVECQPKTGRTHQIRVHLSHLGHPIVGDTTYLGKKRSKIDPLWCPRQFLHAQRIVFNHPRTQQKLQFEADLSSDLSNTLALLS